MATADRIFSSPANWDGGFYELEIRIGALDDLALDAMLSALAERPELTGFYLDQEVEPGEQGLVVPTVALLQIHGHLFAVADLFGQREMPCGVFLGCSEDGPTMTFYLPVGARFEAFVEDDRYPFGPIAGSLEWRAPLDEWLARIGLGLAKVVPFTSAHIGFEVDDCGPQDRAELKMIDGILAYVPAQR